MADLWRIERRIDGSTDKPMDVIAAVRRTLDRYALLPPGSRVAVALSGGADSVALTFVLAELAERCGFQLVGVAHLNHQLRGAEADGDEAFCRALAGRLGLPIDVERIDVAAVARGAGMSLESAGHAARAGFYRRAAARLGASVIAVAHTKDDQAETFLLRLLRGAGPRGLSGMHARADNVVRPLLETSRADARAFLAARGEAFREDSSNADTSIPRNRVRHDLLPLLESRFAPGIVDVLDRAASIAREDAEYLDAAAGAAWDRLAAVVDGGIALDEAALLREPAAIARRVVRLAQIAAAGSRFVGFDAADAVLRFAVSKSEKSLDLPGHRVNRRGGKLVLTKSRGRRQIADAVGFSYQLEVPGLVAVPEAGCAIAATVEALPANVSAGDVWHLAGRSDEAVLAARSLATPLVVRNRRPGDRFQPLGLRGRKKLQDLFVDAKIERSARDATPVIVDAEGRIVWVAGHALAQEFRVTDTTRDVVILKRVPI
jgi:tRNA(Ile)-lysidine synthase